MTSLIVLAAAALLAIVVAPILAAIGRARARAIAEEAKRQAGQLLEEGRREAGLLKNRALVEARETIAAERSRAEEDATQRIDAVRAEERRLEQVTHDLEQKEQDAVAREGALAARETTTARQEQAAAAARAAAEAALGQQTARLEQIAGLTQEDARTELTQRIEGEVRTRMAAFVKRAAETAQEEADRNARTLIAQAIHRSSARVTVQSTMSPIKLPSDEIKGRIIGREGRNIRAIEAATGVDVIIDDTPNTLLLSSYDPQRREVARIAIERLIEDGRVHPARIEEVTQKVREEIETIVMQAGEAAALDLGLTEIHPKLLRLVGRLKFRTSHGTNLLDHSKEVASLAGYMAAELGARVVVARRAGLLHEIAQADDDPPMAPAVLASAEMCGKFGEQDEVVHAIGAIHRSIEPRSLEALLVAAAERIALNRPGARNDNLGTFIERLGQFETIAASFAGVRKAYAVRAGKELRVIVDADVVSDEGVMDLSRSIAMRLEQEADYPGQVRVSVIREIRAVDFAV